MIEEKRIQIEIPGGELEKNVFTFFEGLGLECTAVDRRYLHPSRKYAY
jgi:hypothetical protein